MNKHRRAGRRYLKRAQEVKDAGERDGWTAEREEEFERLANLAEEALDRAEELENSDALRGLTSRGFIDDGGTIMAKDGGYDGDGFTLGQDEDGREIRGFRDSDSMFAWNRRRKGYDAFWSDVTVGGYLRSLLKGPETEAERRALEEGSDPAGGHTVPEPLRDQILDRLREESILRQLGVTFVPMESETLKIAKLASDVSVDWIAEGSTASSTDPTFSSVTLDAKKVLGHVKASRELVDDSVGMESALERSFVGSFDKALQDAVFNGAGSSVEPLGIHNSTDVESINFGSSDGTAPSSTGENWDRILVARERLLNNNVSAGARVLSAAWNPRSERQFFSLRAGDSQPLRRPELMEGVRFHTTPAMPSTFDYGSTSLSGLSEIQLGDWSQVVVGARMAPRIEVLRERHATSWELGFVAGARWDVGVLHPSAMIRVERIST